VRGPFLLRAFQGRGSLAIASSFVPLLQSLLREARREKRLDLLESGVDSVSPALLCQLVIRALRAEVLGQRLRIRDTGKKGAIQDVLVI